MSAAAQNVFEFGDFTLDPAQRLLTGKGGEPIAITAKAFDALVCLVAHAGEVVPRTALAEALWPRTVVEDNNLSQTILALRRALGDDSGEARYVVTVPRRGYQFVATVRRREHEAAAASAATKTLDSPPRWRRYAGVLVGAVTIAAVLAGGRYWLGSNERATGTAPASPEASRRAVLPRSVAVLPFQNMSPRPEDAYFAAGMHEEVLIQLARISDVNVIGNTSVLRYAENAPPIPTIAADLNVGAVVEGSVRFAAERVRVSVRLVDGATSREIWSEAYDTPLDDVFAVQGEIAIKIANALTPTLSGTRTRLAPPTESVAAYAAYLKGLSLYRTNGGIGVSVPAPIRVAMLELLYEALALDPRFAAALAWRANVNVDALLFDAWLEAGRDTAVRELMASIEDDAQRAIALDPAQGVAHTALARLNMYRWRLDESRVTMDRALALSPNDSVVLHYSAMIDFLRDDPVAAVSSARRALELDPKNPAPHTPLAMSLGALGNREESAATYQAMIDLAPTAVIGYIGLAKMLTAGGDDAKIVQTLRIAEQFLQDLRTFRLDAALSYAHAGAHEDAARLVGDFMRHAQGYRVDPGLEAMAALALGDYEHARTALQTAITMRTNGMDPMPLEQIRRNTWSDPVLEQPAWRDLRSALAFRR
jgi:TolB-like protein/DNA-binding winged helix-turn-helix (wHTH) protein/tetratricopeptide (TPR) repeat protein